MLAYFDEDLICAERSIILSPVYSSFAAFGFQLSVSHPLFSCLLPLAVMSGVVVSVTLSQSSISYYTATFMHLYKLHTSPVIAGHRTQEEKQKIDGKQRARFELLLVLPIATACCRHVCMNDVAAASYGGACHSPLRSPATPAVRARHALNTAHHDADSESRDHR